MENKQSNANIVCWGWIYRDLSFLLASPSSNTFNLLEKLCQKLSAHVAWAGGRKAQQSEATSCQTNNIHMYSRVFIFQNTFQIKGHILRKYILSCLGDSDCDQSPLSPGVWSKSPQVVLTTGCNKTLCNLKGLLRSVYEWLSCTETQASVWSSHTIENEITNVLNL